MAEVVEHFQAARTQPFAARAAGKVGHPVDDAYGDAASGQVAGKREAGRASTDHEDISHSERARTRDAIADAAISLSLTHGFDEVPVADIAARAEVSKPTLFRYFPAKEDLVLHRFADHNGEAARVVRDRQPGVSPLTALHRHFLDGLDRCDPVTGLNDHPEVLRFHELVFTCSAVISPPGSRRHNPEAAGDADRAFALLQAGTGEVPARYDVQSL